MGDADAATIFRNRRGRLRHERIGLLRPVPELPEPDVGVRCLADYDTALGVADDDGVA